MSDRSRVSIFLSSPSDVRPEREAAERVVSRLGGVYAAHVELALDRWERHFYEASRGFQEAIASMETFDLVVGILWKRIGSELPPDRFPRPDGTPFESGTIYELETALAAAEQAAHPSVYVFKKTARILFSKEHAAEEFRQSEALDCWWARTFHDAAGRHLRAFEPFATTEEFESKFENFLVRWLEQKGHISSGPVWDVETQGSPYPGLVAYDRKYSPVFFGRHLAVEHARDELLAATAREGGRPALFVIGASGSGKSSLVRAGLVPRLTAPGAVPGVDLWRTGIAVPAADSLGSLAAQLYASEGLPELAEGPQPVPERWTRMATGSPEATADAVAWALDRVAEAEGRRTGADRKLEARLLLVIDQLETLFGTPGQGAFTKVLRALVEGGRVWLLATLRSDRYDELQRDCDLLALKRAGAVYDLPPPGPAEIADVVKGPARAAGLTFAQRDGRSLARVLVEAAPHADALPLLQITLAQLFERRHSAELTFAAYEAMGGVEGAIAAHANAVFDRVPPAGQRELDPLVQALVRDVARGEDGQIRFTPRVADRKAFETSDARRSLVGPLVEGRLLVSDEGDLRVGHEALLRRWNRAKGSLERLADAELRAAQRVALREEARRTADTASALLEVTPNQALEPVVAASARCAEAGIEPPLRLAEVLYEVACWARQLRRQPGHIAAVRAIACTRDGWVASAGDDRTIRLWTADGEAAGAAEQRHQAGVGALAFAPGGDMLASAADDGRILLWTLVPAGVAGGPRIVEPRIVSIWPDVATAIAFDVMHDRLVAVSEVGMLWLWRMHDLEPSRSIVAHQDFGTACGVDAANERVFTAGGDGWVASWALRDLVPLRRTKAHDGPVCGLAVHPNGKFIATAGWDGVVRLWTPDLTPVGRPFEGHRRYVAAVSFGPSGRSVISVGGDGAVRQWELDGRPMEPPLRGHEDVQGHEDAVSCVAVQTSPPMIVTGGADRMVHWWDHGGRMLTEPIGGIAEPLFREPLNVVLFPTDRDILASCDQRIHCLGRDGNAVGRPWEGHESYIWALAVSPGRDAVASASADSTVRLWDLEGHCLTDEPLKGHEGDVTTVAFTPDGANLVSAGTDGMIRLWHRDGSAAKRVLGQHEGQVNIVLVAKRERGCVVLSGGNDGYLRLWGLDGTVVGSRLAHEAGVRYAAVSADGERIVSTGVHGDLRVWSWDLEPGASVTASDEPISMVLTDPSGGVLTAGADGMVRRWTRDLEPFGRALDAHPGGTWAMDLSPTREVMVTGGQDGRVRIWRAGTWRSWLRTAEARLRVSRAGAAWLAGMLPPIGR